MKYQKETSNIIEILKNKLADSNRSFKNFHKYYMPDFYPYDLFLDNLNWFEEVDQFIFAACKKFFSEVDPKERMIVKSSSINQCYYQRNNRCIHNLSVQYAYFTCIGNHKCKILREQNG